MTVLSYTNAFAGIPFPNHGSGQARPQSFLYPGAVQPVKGSLVVLRNSEAFLGLPFPNKGSGQSKPQSFLYPGAVQPIVQVPSTLTMQQLVFM